MNILIAEDNPMIQAFNCDLMDAWGYEFDMVSNGIEAVEYARRNSGKYDLCLMDVEMPEMNGIEATRRIREKLAYFPIMALTANSNYRSECFAVGMDEFVQKPCLPSQLLGIIKELTVKTILVNLNGENRSITKVMPKNSDELKELRELKKRGLARIKLSDPGNVFVVHKDIQNKMFNDLIKEGKDISEFIDRSSSDPGRYRQYKTDGFVKSPKAVI